MNSTDSINARHYQKMLQTIEDYQSGKTNSPTIVNRPTTEQPMYDIAMGSAADVDKAVAAARRALD
jgi:acyl-CoA reductase-like NAD-dependent aldehyde dehydrogenase